VLLRIAVGDLDLAKAQRVLDHHSTTLKAAILKALERLAMSTAERFPAIVAE